MGIAYDTPWPAKPEVCDRCGNKRGRYNYLFYVKTPDGNIAWWCEWCISNRILK